MRNEGNHPSARTPWLLVAAFVISQSGCVYLDHNFRPVEREALYRSGQMPDHRLAQFINSHGIRTVVNLRGVAPGEPWYQEERAVCDGLGVAHHDLAWSMKQLPEPQSLDELVTILDSAERPILVHCHGGTHRAAIASAAFLLMQGEPLDVARGQIGLFFNRAPIGDLLKLYGESDSSFRDWLRDSYPSQYAEWLSRQGESQTSIVAETTSN
jgi:protein tyrosine phosphatase (PTP) superfamily phosphohydrolase (DUF442 family)